MTSAGTAVYRAIARSAANVLGRSDAVLGVYVRRSVASGDVVFGRSDVDLHALVAGPGSPEAEGELLCELARRIRTLKRLLPCIGHVDVSTRTDLERWYREQPAQWLRDRGWLRLYGPEFERPRPPLDDAARERALWWYGWALQLLPHSFRRGNARTCCNLLLDMFDVYRLYARLCDDPLSRRELAALWYESGPPSDERRTILAAHGRGFRGHRGGALEPLYRESLRLHDELYRRTPGLEGVASGELRSRVPPTFAERTYLVVELHDRPALDAALARMRRDGGAWALNDSGLKLHLLARNPWEHLPLAAANPGLGVAAPPEDAFRRAIARSLYREIPRHFGLLGEDEFLGPLYAQAWLYSELGLVAGSAAELRGRFEERSATELWPQGSRVEFFREQYPAICRLIDRLRARPV